MIGKKLAPHLPPGSRRPPGKIVLKQWAASRPSYREMIAPWRDVSDEFRQKPQFPAISSRHNSLEYVDSRGVFEGEDGAPMVLTLDRGEIRH
jgi:hypothetical protein